jgi:hypothetical protein
MKNLFSEATFMKTRCLMFALCFTLFLCLNSESTTAQTPSPYTGEKTPDGKDVCADWVHEQYRTPGADGKLYTTWHPQIDPVHNCVFGHEHGSDPRKFTGFSTSGMPAFGYATTVSQHDHGGELEAHAGFKVYVVNNDLRGKAWMLVLHQGTASPKRATVQHHTVEVWLIKKKNKALLAHVNLLADFGVYQANCPDVELSFPNRVLPQVGCESVYESWNPDIRIGGYFKATPNFDVDNATTRFNVADPAGTYANTAACGSEDSFGWKSSCKGDKRSMAHPRWILNNTGTSSTFYTDAFGNLADGPGDGRIEQFVRKGTRLDESAECCGNGVVYIMQSPAKGGFFINQSQSTGQGQTMNFEYPGYTIRWKN